MLPVRRKSVPYLLPISYTVFLLTVHNQTAAIYVNLLTFWLDFVSIVLLSN